MALTAAQSAFVRRVLQKVDSVDPAGSSISGDYDEIYASAEEAARQFLLEAPKKLINAHAQDDTTPVAAEVTANAYNMVVPLPPDYLRLHTLWLEGWTAPVYEEAIDGGEDDVYRDAQRLQPGTIDRPVLFEVFSEATTYGGTLSLDCYPGSSEAVPVKSFIYFPVVAPELFDAAILEPLLWLAAGIHFLAIDPALAEACEARYRRRLKLRRQINPVSLNRKVGMI